MAASVTHDEVYIPAIIIKHKPFANTNISDKLESANQPSIDQLSDCKISYRVSKALSEDSVFANKNKQNPI